MAAGGLGADWGSHGLLQPLLSNLLPRLASTVSHFTPLPRAATFATDCGGYLAPWPGFVLTRIFFFISLYSHCNSRYFFSFFYKLYWLIRFFFFNMLETYGIRWTSPNPMISVSGFRSYYEKETVYQERQDWFACLERHWQHLRLLFCRVRCSDYASQSKKVIKRDPRMTWTCLWAPDTGTSLLYVTASLSPVLGMRNVNSLAFVFIWKVDSISPCDGFRPSQTTWGILPRLLGSLSGSWAAPGECITCFLYIDPILKFCRHLRSVLEVEVRELVVAYIRFFFYSNCGKMQLPSPYRNLLEYQKILNR